MIDFYAKLYFFLLNNLKYDLLIKICYFLVHIIKKNLLIIFIFINNI